MIPGGKDRGGNCLHHDARLVAQWREQQQRWDRLHYARVAIIVAGFVLTLVAGTVA